MRDLVEVVLIGPPAALTFDKNDPTPFPIHVPVTFSDMQPRSRDLPMLAANSNFMTLASAGGTLFGSGRRLTVVGIGEGVSFTA